MQLMCKDSEFIYIEEECNSRVRIVALARVIVFYKLTKIEAELIDMIAPHHRAELHDVVVLPECRSRGYARMLVEKAIEYAKSTDAQRIVLTSRDNKEGAQTLYRSVGFRPVERQSPMFELKLT
jgi:ribosomal protein S18 acetylase RimI-like enzyme